MNSRRFFLFLLIGSVTISALLGVTVILIGEMGEFEARILATSTVITCMSLLGVACGTSLEHGKSRPVAVAGIVGAVTSALIWMPVIWSSGQRNEFVVKAGFTATLAAVSFTYAALLALARLDRKYAWARYAAYLAVAALSGLALYIIWIDDGPSDFMGRVIGALSVIIGALTVIVPIFHRLSGSAGELAKIDEEIAALRSRLEELEKRKSAMDEADE